MGSNDSNRKKPEKFKGAKTTISQKHDLAPQWLVYIVFLISFALPNLVFSGRHFFDTLHIMKWTVTMVPVGVLALVAGVQLVRFGRERTNFTLDPFGIVWLLLVVLISLQPFFVKLSSVSTYAKEWFYFASLFAVYILSYNLFKTQKLHRVILWGGNLNAALNVLFAELLIRHLNSGIPFILDVPGNYIGNTAQQEMFGLWTAMTVLNGLFLHLYYVGGEQNWKDSFKRPLVLANLFILAVNSWGLWSSTTRGAILSLLVAFVVLVLSLWRTGHKDSLKKSFALFGMVLMFVVIVLVVSSALGTGRGSSLVGKTMDMITNPGSVGGRISIWRTSWEVYLKEPIAGVGLGQYKWHFLDGQRVMYEKYPELYKTPGYNWQFTYWAHSEYLQWLAETGLIGAIMLMALAAWWLFAFIKALIRGDELPPEAIWGIAMVFLLWFDALFSRPFHRIENSVWMALAFALANRSILPQAIKSRFESTELVYKIFGAMLVGVTLYGFVFLAGGIEGDQLLFNSITKRSTVLEKQEQLKKAEKYLMSRDDAKENLAQLYIRVGASQKNEQIMDEGVKNLYLAFVRRPTSKLLFEVVKYAQETGHNEILHDLTRYMSPNMYRRVPAVSAPRAVSQ